MGVERSISRVLRVGMLASIACVLFGGVLFLVRHAGERVHVASFEPAHEPLRSLGGIAREAARLDAAAWMQAGVVLLILTPLARVLTTLVFFVRRRDWVFAGLGLLVLGALIFGLAV